MNFENLPQNSLLRKLLLSCKIDHDLCLTVCNDGAMIVDCFDCPFRMTLSIEEEEAIHALEGDGQSSIFPIL